MTEKIWDLLFFWLAVWHAGSWFPQPGIEPVPHCSEARSALGTSRRTFLTLADSQRRGLCQRTGDVEDQFEGFALYLVENEERNELSKICNLVVQAAWWCLIACLG